MAKSRVCEMGVADAVSNAFSDMESLKDELQDWYDNLPESFQNGTKGEQLQEAIDLIEGVSEIDVPDAVEDATCAPCLMTKKRMSRSDRRDDCVNQLNVAAAWARERIEELNGMEFEDEEDSEDESEAPDTDKVVDATVPTSEDERDSMVSDLETFADECENAASEFESVEFPGMYG